MMGGWPFAANGAFGEFAEAIQDFKVTDGHWVALLRVHGSFEGGGFFAI